jgi:HEPN domain-containing protein
VPKIHDLGVLLTTLRPHYPVLRPLRRGMAFLTNFAVPVRYPGYNASKRQAEAALRWADQVRTEARALLGTRPRRARRKKSP